ncbi:MAG: hypothetical protein HND40_09985 [Ignavibacteriota bacterium]|jgi:hypothetical protein|nr:MAG: hypothetical protein F9K42_09250 [Ignavibacterium sp.]MBL1153920.1 hypothetical protein [Ignavibacteriota bacterium]MCO6447846.1 hypothetical protein [Ignavibacterium album]MCZ2269222.1 hypothetical protein [Ignavibacteriales bacterium]MDX9711176.1 hypothetical protein [Ignavibacteriaceae bacterium]
MAKIKNVEAFCSICGTVRKMELTGEVVGEDNKRWAKCKKCKQTMVIDMTEDVVVQKISLDGIENENCVTYSPKNSYEIGQTIFHENWNDFGKVVSKEVLSNGQKSISVEFQKSGNKKLVESYNKPQTDQEEQSEVI